APVHPRGPRIPPDIPRVPLNGPRVPLHGTLGPGPGTGVSRPGTRGRVRGTFGHRCRTRGPPAVPGTAVAWVCPMAAAAHALAPLGTAPRGGSRPAFPS